MSTIFRVAVWILALGILVVLLIIFGCRCYFYHIRKSFKRQSKKTVAFFHPFCSSGGGGERVLWKSIQALDELKCQGFDFDIIIYTADPPDQMYERRKFISAILHMHSFTQFNGSPSLTCKELFKHVESRFMIPPPKSLKITFVHLCSYSHFLCKF
jgi:ALG11 mannosyltransferase N-terminus